MPVVTTTGRGQIVIPKKVRNRLRLSPGNNLLIKVEGAHAVLRPLPDDPVEYYCGFFPGDSSLTGALLEERKKDRDREEKEAVG
jgi:AbrB family looped-hinge helix DNA binding protein